jgi:hypothetical protein
MAPRPRVADRRFDGGCLSSPPNAHNLFFRELLLLQAGPPQVEENRTYLLVQFSEGTSVGD